MNKVKFRDLNIFNKIKKAVYDFFREDGLDKASVLAYYSIISTLFLLTFFSFIFTRIIGSREISIKGIYPFSPEFFNKISPHFMEKAQELSNHLKDIGIIGILFSIFLGVLIFKKIVQYVNEMNHIKIGDEDKNTSFWVRRISEIALLFIVGILAFVSFFITGIITTVLSLFYKVPFFSKYINRDFVNALDTFGIKFIAPFLITFLIFYFLFKWIPEKKIYKTGAVISALISAFLWEIAKRVYTYYLVNVSIVGKIGGPIIAIILFGFWMELSMGIMLFGAKLTHIFDKEINGKFKKNQHLS